LAPSHGFNHKINNKQSDKQKSAAIFGCFSFYFQTKCFAGSCQGFAASFIQNLTVCYKDFSTRNINLYNLKFFLDFPQLVYLEKLPIGLANFKMKVKLFDGTSKHWVWKTEWKAAKL
jgi:hypothetical protein